MKKIIILTALMLVAVPGLLITSGRTDSTLEQGRQVYTANCLLCHGQNGKGDGPASVVLNPKPADYTKPDFWVSDAAKTIAATIKKGKGQMPPFGLDEQSIQAVIYFIEHTFKPAAAPKS
jgi:mono/diheme cytochrome c family protein